DYLYIPLGGNRKGPTRTTINLMLTMLLGGLWHGANWTFVVWGGLHGTALAVGRARERARERRGEPRNPVAGWTRFAGTVLTFHFVCLAWVFFRADSFAGARSMLAQLSMLTTFHPNLPPKVVLVLAVGLGSHFVPERWYARIRDTF